VSSAERLYDPDRVLLGTTHAIERVRARSAEAIEPDDLLAGVLLAVARFGIVDLGDRVIDLADLDLRFDLPVPDLALKPRYTPAAAAVFDRAVRVARADGGARLAPIHLLVALGDPSVPAFARLAERLGIDATGWRRALAAVPMPARPQAPDPQGASDPAALRERAPAAAPPSPLDLSGALLTPEEAARALGVHIQTLRGYIRAGKLPAFRVAGERAIRIRRDDLAALLEHLRVLPASAGVPADEGQGADPPRAGATR
jgi:excisionase family DNA binding protein